MSETCRCSWDDVWRMTAIEWLNHVAYRIDKIAHDKAQLEQWKKTH